MTKKYPNIKFSMNYLSSKRKELLDVPNHRNLDTFSYFKITIHISS